MSLLIFTRIFWNIFIILSICQSCQSLKDVTVKTQLHLALFRSLSLYPVATENIASQVTEFVYVCDSCKNLSPLLLLPPTGFE